MKKIYSKPQTEVYTTGVQQSFLLNVSGGDTGIGVGGGASENGMPDPNVKEEGDWDIW